MPKSVITHHARTPCWGDPPIFHSDHDAVQWAIGQGAFADVEAANAALVQLRSRYDLEVWPLWLREVGRRLEGVEQARTHQTTYDIARNRKTVQRQK